MDELKTYAQAVLEHGPARVVINADGEAVSSVRAREQRGVIPVIVFIRKDGWSLGAPEHLAHVAERMWREDWIGVLEYPNQEPQSYQEWALSRGVKG